MKLATGLERAFIGTVERFGMQPVACYNVEVILDGYMSDGMSREEALEFFDFNVIGAWVGEDTPCFVTPMPLPELLALYDDDTETVPTDSEGPE